MRAFLGEILYHISGRLRALIDSATRGNRARTACLSRHAAWVLSDSSPRGTAQDAQSGYTYEPPEREPGLMVKKPDSSELELKQDLDFERRSWTIERIGWTVMGLVVLAALTGLFGAGPLSATTAGEKGGPLWLEYPRFGRLKAPLMLRVHLGPNTLQQGPVRLWLGRDYLESVQIEAVTPPPEEVEAGPERLTYVFPVSEPSRSTAVTFFLKADQIGRQGGCIGLVEGPTLCFRQFIYP
jgi:hypothetical protein